MAFLGELFRTFFWPIIRDELIAFFQRLETDAEFKKEIVEIVHLETNATTDKEVSEASKRLKAAMARK